MPDPLYVLPDGNAVQLDRITSVKAVPEVEGPKGAISPRVVLATLALSSVVHCDTFEDAKVLRDLIIQAVNAKRGA